MNLLIPELVKIEAKRTLLILHLRKIEAKRILFIPQIFCYVKARASELAVHVYKKNR